MKAIDRSKIKDEVTDRVCRSIGDAVREIQDLPVLGGVIIKDILLPNDVRTPIAHGLGRKPSWVQASAVRGSVTVGCIVEFRNGVDRAKQVDIAASGYGATVTVDLLVVL